MGLIVDLLGIFYVLAVFNYPFYILFFFFFLFSNFMICKACSALHGGNPDYKKQQHKKRFQNFLNVEKLWNVLNATCLLDLSVILGKSPRICINKKMFF